MSLTASQYFEIKRQSKIDTERKKGSIKCFCSRRILKCQFKDGVAICGNCGNPVFADKKAEFKYKMRTKMIRKNREFKVYDFNTLTLEESAFLEGVTWREKSNVEYDKHKGLFIVEVTE